MAKILEMPKLSPTMTEGQLTLWHKKEGDEIAVDDLLAEVETDKATMEFRSFDKGTLLKLLTVEGSMVQLGQPVAILGVRGEDISALLAAAPKAPETTTSAPGQPVAPNPIPSVPTAAASSAPISSPTAAADPATLPLGRLKASPYVRKVARERGLDLHVVPGTGPHGRIVARDLEIISAAPSSPPRANLRTDDEHRPLSMMRKTIARRLTESKQTVPHFYLTIDVDAEPLRTLREQINRDLSAGEDATASPGPLKVSMNDLLIKACALGLREVPECNASFSPDALIVHHRVDISVAVAISDGLVTPVIRNADMKSVAEIALEIRELASRAKAKKLQPAEMSDGTFSISNLGMFGIDAFSAVINPPEGAILAIGQTRPEPVVRNGAVVPGWKLAMTLSCDHRAIDGAVGARFLAALRRLVEHPLRLLVM